MADEPEPKTDMLTNMVNMMKMNGLDTDSPAVKEQIQGFLAKMVMEQAMAS